jgi:ABC-type transport system involved in cytochrome c biogenesis permease subunit
MGRPPVTNLYSSALFVGWGVALASILLERLFQGGVGTLVGAVSGWLSIVLAGGLAGEGDTMAVLQAVLDTNFWLATHVVVITLGYAACFLAGFLGLLALGRGLLTTSLDTPSMRQLASMTYGVVCFATLASFVGTILGGIWADQSWGRFWGWDPKENGALLIVLWNAVILHARWGGLVRERGLFLLAIGGNVVTAWSWFGTNMLGVGLHAYGFMDQALFWLLLFVGSQLLLIGVGLLPTRLWRSDPWAKLPPEPAPVAAAEAAQGEPQPAEVAAPAGAAPPDQPPPGSPSSL